MSARRVIAAAMACLSVLVGSTGLATAEPANVGDTKADAVAYHDSGQYMHDLAEVAAQAIVWIGNQVPVTDRPAVVFDIDETALSNWDVIKADDFGFFLDGPCTLPAGPCGYRAWDLSAQSSVIQPILDTFNAAKAAGATVFFITGRDETLRAATEKNLRSAGYSGYARLFMKPAGVRYASAADFKAPQRAAIEEIGYTIVANIGDQPSDLAGGHAQQTFLLPDPFYRIP